MSELVNAELVPIERPVASRTRGQWGALGALLLGIVAMFSNIYATQPILPLLGQAFHVTPAASGLTISVVVLGLGIASLIYGPLSDRIGRKPVMIVTSLALLIPTGLAALAPNFTFFLVCRTAQGLLIPGTTAVGLAYLQEEFPPEMRGLGTSAYVSATALGGLVGRLQGGFIAETFGWRWAFASFLLPVAVCAFLMVLLLPARPRLATAGGRLGPRELWRVYAALGAYFRQRRVVGGAVIGLTMFFAFVSVFTYIPYRVGGPPFNLSTSATSLLYLVYLVGFAVTPFTGPLSDRIGRRAVIGMALTLMLAGIVATVVDNLLAVIIGLLLLNVGLLAAHAAATALVGDLAEGSKRGAATSFYLVFYYLGGTLGPPIVGLVWQSIGWAGVAGLCIVSVALAVIADVVLCA